MSNALANVNNTMALTVMVSGSTTLSRELFDKYYRPAILKYHHAYHCRWIVGNASGVDAMTQELLHELGLRETVTVYDVSKDTNANSKDRLRFPGFQFRADFEKYPLRDIKMTTESDVDIAFLTPEQGMSGTAANLIRRLFRTDPYWIENSKYKDPGYAIVEYLRTFQMKEEK